MGQLCGDALGGPREGAPGEPLSLSLSSSDLVGGGPRGLAPGQISHELLLVCARALASEGGYDPERVAAAYVGWQRSRPLVDDPALTRALSGFPESRSLAAGLAARADPESLSGAGLPRVAALALQGWSLEPDELGARIARDARLTHPHPACRHAAVLLGYAIAFATRTGAAGPEVYASTLAYAEARRWHPEIEGDLVAAEEGPGAEPGLRGAFQGAFHLLVRAPSLAEGIAQSVAGPEPSLRGAVSGALLGAVFGAAELPAPWREAVLACRTPRGPAHQTGDVERLADALLRCGDPPEGAPPRA